MHMLSPKAVYSSRAMEHESPGQLHRSTSLPSRHPLPAIAPEPSSSITRPYRLSPSTTRGFSPSSFTPSALLQRRSNANQGLFPVNAPSAGSTDDRDPPSPASAQAKKLLPPAADHKPPSAYEVLDVSRSASQQEIKTSFWRLARQHHPDKTPLEQREASSRIFLQIHSAYNTLKDPQARARHDLELSFLSSPGSMAGVRTPHFCSPSPRVFATHGQPITPRGAANAYTPRSQLYTSRGSNAATPTFTPRTPYSGRNWETDQCW